MSQTILVVDDEAANRELLEGILTEDGYQVVQAVDGGSALTLAQAQRPDLVLLDLMMPGMSGFDVCQRLRRDPKTGGIPIIVVTALGEIASKEAALTSGADDFVMKPVKPQDLRARVAAILKVRSVRGELDRTLAYLHELGALRRAESRQALDGLLGSAPPAPAAGPPGIPVLLVEDESLTREFYGDLLRDHGFQVWTSISGPEALEIARRQQPEVVILDVMMPQMSGFEVLERLQRDDPDLPVIMLTAHGSSQNAITALKAGAFDFLVKGLAHELVVLAVHRAVRHRRETQSRRTEVEQLRARVQELEAKTGSPGGGPEQTQKAKPAREPR